MMNKLPPLGPLISFRAAATHQSFTKAAQALNVTHGAVSRAVKQLETHFGFALFQRRNRRIYLTEKGAFFAQRVAVLLEELGETCEQMQQRRDGESLAVSCEPTLAMRWVMPRLNAFHDRYPELDVQLSTAGGPVDLQGANIDLAIRRSDFQWPQDYWVSELACERLALVCHRDYWHKWQHSGGFTVLHSRTRASAWDDWQGLSGYRVQPNDQRFFDHFYFSLQAAVAGLGVAIGPEPLVRDDIASGHLIAPFGFVSTQVQYVALSLNNPQRVERLQLFIDWLIEELANSA